VLLLQLLLNKGSTFVIVQLFFRNVESTKICVVGHSHPSSFTSSRMFDHVL